MSASKNLKPLDSRNIGILFFSALGISLLVLVLLFSFFFKNLDFNLKTKELEEAPRLEEAVQVESTTNPNEADVVNSETLEERLDVNVPEEAGRLRRFNQNADQNKARKSVPYVGIETKKNEASSKKEAPVKENTSVPVPSDETPEATSPSLRSKTTVAVQKYRVYLGGFFSREDAEATQSRLKAQGYSSILKQTNSGFEVQLGVYTDADTAKQTATSTGASLEAL